MSCSPDTSLEDLQAFLDIILPAMKELDTQYLTFIQDFIEIIKDCFQSFRMPINLWQLGYLVLIAIVFIVYIRIDPCHSIFADILYLVLVISGFVLFHYVDFSQFFGGTVSEVSVQDRLANLTAKATTEKATLGLDEAVGDTLVCSSIEFCRFLKNHVDRINSASQIFQAELAEFLSCLNSKFC
jgi:hypothetical protein